MATSPALPALAIEAEPGAASIDAALPAYDSDAQVYGTLSSAGSDTMVNLMTFWAQAFQQVHPAVSIQVQGAGSATSPPALIEGTVTFGAMSRRMKAGEIEAFEARHGYRPTAIRVAVDALAVYVHRDNPLPSISLPALDAVFSATRRCGRGASVDTWAELGVDNALALRPIQLFGRNSVSGTYGYFKDAVLCQGDFRPSVNEQPGSASVVQAVATSPASIGYSGIGYRTSRIRALPLARRDGAPAIEATPENAINGSYPLARYLYLYVNKRPGEGLGSMERAFVRFVLSADGQELVVRDGYVPLPARIVERELARLD